MSALEVVLTSHVQRFLDVYMYENARFLAERLVAHVCSILESDAGGRRSWITRVARLE